MSATRTEKITALTTLTGLTTWDVEALLAQRVVDRTGDGVTVRDLTPSDLVKAAEFGAFTTLETHTWFSLAVQFGATLPEALAAAAAGADALRELVAEYSQPAQIAATDAARFWEGTLAQ